MFKLFFLKVGVKYSFIILITKRKEKKKKKMINLLSSLLNVIVCEHDIQPSLYKFQNLI